jgi:hypothetical protein
VSACEDSAVVGGAVVVDEDVLVVVLVVDVVVVATVVVAARVVVVAVFGEALFVAPVPPSLPEHAAASRRAETITGRIARRIVVTVRLKPEMG